MNKEEDAMKYLLTFLEAYYLLNCQSDEVMKFYPVMVPYQVTKMSTFAQYDEISPLCVPPG